MRGHVGMKNQASEEGHMSASTGLQSLKEGTLGGDLDFWKGAPVAYCWESLSGCDKADIEKRWAIFSLHLSAAMRKKMLLTKKREISGVLFTATTSSQKVNRKVQATFFSQSLASSLPLVPFISWVPQVAEKSCSIKKQSRRMDLWFKKKKEKNYWQVCYLFHKKGKIRCA